MKRKSDVEVLKKAKEVAKRVGGDKQTREIIVAVFLAGYQFAHEQGTQSPQTESGCGMSDTPRTDDLSIGERAMTFAEACYWINQYKNLARQLERELSESRAECERLRKDAERYQFVRSMYLPFFPKIAEIMHDKETISVMRFDEAIDQAIRELKD